MRMLITRPMPDRVLEVAHDKFDVTIRQDNTYPNESELISALADHDIVLATLGDRFSREVIEGVADPRCRLIANFGVGYNHIDAVAAAERGIAVTNTPGTVTDATADIALTLILMTTRRAAEGERLVRSGRWEGWNPTQMLGLHVSGKTLGIVGMGRIGKAIARRAHYGFGMKVRFFNRSQVADPGVPAAQVGSLTDLARGSDIIVIAVPGGAATHHLIGRDFLASMPRHAIFVNISRGDVVDETALVEALEAGQIAGAGLDVYEAEPFVPARLRALENAVLLPHLGTAALEVREAMGLMALDNAIAFAEGRALPNSVNG